MDDRPPDPPARHGEPETDAEPRTDFEKAARPAELKRIRDRRKAVNEDATELDATEPLAAGLVGLAFSGGGIRSATFNLGILQALSRLKLLTRIDYLSTVSGGGYIGAWLAAWIYRAPGASPAERVRAVETNLDTRWTRLPDPPVPPAPAPLPRGLVRNESAAGAGPQAEPEPVQHLREHSRYLALNSGVLTLDMWSLLSIYVRNVFINALIVVPLLLLVVFSCRLLIAGYGAHGGSACVAFGAITFVALFVLTNFLVRRQAQLIAHDAHAAQTTGGAMSDAARNAGPYAFWPGVFPLLVVSLLVAYLSVWLPRTVLEPADSGDGPGWPKDWVGNWLGGWVSDVTKDRAGLVIGLMFAGLFLASAGVAAVVSSLKGRSRSPSWRSVLGVGLNGLAFGVLYVGLVKYVLFYDPHPHPTLFVTFGPPLFILCVLAAGYVEVAVSGTAMDEFEREWRSRLAAVLFRAGFLWLLVFTAVVYLPYGLREFTPTLFHGRGPGRDAPWVAAAGWLLTVVVGFLMARRTTSHSSKWLLVTVRVVPLIFLVGLFAIASEVSLLIVWPANVNELLYFERLERSRPLPVLGAVVSCLGALVLALWLVPASLFSLHALYMNRLTRCYLGASRAGETRDAPGPGLRGTPLRLPNRFSGFDPRDDLPLADLRGTPDEPYPGPYPLVTTTLNLVGGQDLAYQDRKGSSFVLTPDYCGSRETGYAPLPTDDHKYNLTLGRAMAISGAAIDPNMKDYQSAQLTAFLTVLNARLGWWIQNPRVGVAGEWTAEPPARWGAVYYLRELFGYTHAQNNYVHLSDGGHFDASGAYELIRRRCRYVIAIDAAEDTSDASENLANLIRLVRADFGIPIEIDTAPLRKDDKGISRWHCAIGAIRYDEVDEKGAAGTFVFIRSSLTGDESADLKNYADTKPPFPHHSTADQFFDADQFESYRMLGEHIGLRVFADANDEAVRLSRIDPASPGGGNRPEDGPVATFNRWLFCELRRRWAPLPVGGEKRYAESCRFYLSETGTAGNALVSRSLYPELRHLYTAADAAAIAADATGEDVIAHRVMREMQAVSWLFQTMELAWLDNGLADFHAHPLNRGWMNSLRRWTASDQFHRFWAVLRPMYSHGFVRFCEGTLNMPDLPVRWCRVDTLARWRGVLDEFDQEFRKEWSDVLLALGPTVSRDRFLSDAVGASDGYAPPAPPRAWVVTLGREGEDRGPLRPDEWTREHIPLGLVVVPRIGRPGVRELLVWIRPWHRGSGLARLTMARLLSEVERTLPDGVTQLVARYPVVGRSGGDQLLRTLWTLFFNDLGFVRDGRPDGELRLVKTVRR